MLGQTIADGILTGAIIALGAIGVSFGLQILRFANFAHSELITWGAYLALAFVGFYGVGTPIGPVSFGWQLILAMLLAGLLTGVLAFIVDALVYRRLRNRGASSLTLVFASFGLAPASRQYALRTTVTNSTGVTNVLIAQLAFGTNGTDGRVFARRWDEDSVYAIGALEYTHMPTAAWQFRDHRVNVAALGQADTHQIPLARPVSVKCNR